MRHHAKLVKFCCKGRNVSSNCQTSIHFSPAEEGNSMQQKDTQRNMHDILTIPSPSCLKHTFALIRIRLTDPTSNQNKMTRESTQRESVHEIFLPTFHIASKFVSATTTAYQ